jgi:hypothetical protein
MIHNIAFRANWDQIKNLKQDIINKSIQKENKNKSQIPYEYKVGDQELLEKPGIHRKFSIPRAGPYPVTNLYKNGTIRIHKEERSCIRKSKYPLNHSIQSKAQLSMILGANDIPRNMN